MVQSSNVSAPANTSSLAVVNQTHDNKTVATAQNMTNKTVSTLATNANVNASTSSKSLHANSSAHVNPTATHAALAKKPLAI